MSIFAGEFRLKKPRMPGVNPAYKETLEIGRTGDNFTKVILEIMPPTFRNPKACLRVSMRNSYSNTFANIAIEDIENLTDALNNLAIAWQEQAPNLEDQEKNILNAMNMVYKKLSLGADPMTLPPNEQDIAAELIEPVQKKPQERYY